MTRALMDIFNGKDQNSTIMAAWISEVNDQGAKLQWSVAGAEPKSYTVEVDGKVVLQEVTGMACEIPVKDLTKGNHTVKITANDVHTYYALSETEYDELPEKPLPVNVNLALKI